MRHRISNNTVSLIRSEKETNLIKKNRGTYLVYSVIKRFKQGRTKDQKRRPAGDNCPILYAMKGRDNLIIQPEDIRLLYEHSKELIQKHFQGNFPYDALILLPSSCNIADQIGQIINSLYGTLIIKDSFLKKTVSEVRDDIYLMSRRYEIDTATFSSLISNLKGADENGLITIKDISMKNRTYVKPFKFNNDSNLKNQLQEVSSVLIIDDIMSSGATIDCAIHLLKREYINIAQIDVLTLFSSLD